MHVDVSIKKGNNKRPAQATIQLFPQFYRPFWWPRGSTWLSPQVDFWRIAI